MLKKLKIPFISYKPEAPELLQGVLMIAVGLSAVPVLMDSLGLSYSAALTAVAIAEALGLLHVLFGDPVVPGWITAALSLVLVYLGGHSVGTDSIHALIALQICVSVLFIVLGATGLAHRLMKLIPGSLKAGVLFGASIAALARVFLADGFMAKYPLSVGSGTVVALFVLFSVTFKKLQDKRRVFREIGKYGMLSSLVAAMVIGFISGELPLPVIKWGIIPLSFRELFTSASPFSIGFPTLRAFAAALPVSVVVYVIAFGEIITSEAVLSECRAARPDVKLDYSSDRTNVVTGVRNLILALFAPFTALAGPVWAAVTVSIGERYKSGSMKNIFGGMGTFKISTTICVLLLPITSLLEPVLPVALACTLVVQGFACSYIAVEQIKSSKVSAGVAGITGAVVYLAGLNAGLIVGVVGYLLMEDGISKLRRKSQ